MYDKIIHSKRRTLGLEITSHGEVILRVPQKVKEKEVRIFLGRNKNWIQKHKSEAIQRAREIPKKLFVHGEYLPYLGRSFPLCISDQKRPKIMFQGYFSLSSTYQKAGREVFVAWAKKEARKVCKERVQVYAERAGREYASVRITSARRRWGSCSGDSLNFTWRLILAPLWVLDYIVAHEVAHLVHKNHGKRFWNKVEKIYPNYKKAEKWLKNHGHLLNV